MIASDLNEAVHVEAVLEVGNERVAKEVGTRQTYEAHGYNVIHRSLLAHLILILNRIYDFSPRRLLVDQDKASVPVVLALLKDEAVANHWRAAAQSWTPGMNREAYNSELVRQRLESAQQRWEVLSADADGREWLASLRRFRDGRVAHSLVDFELGDLPRYGYLGNLVRATIPIAKDLRLAVAGVDWDLEEGVGVARDHAHSFWGPVLDAMK